MTHLLPLRTVLDPVQSIGRNVSDSYSSKQNEEKKSTLRCAPSLLFSHGEKLYTTQRGASQGGFLLLGLFTVDVANTLVHFLTKIIESPLGKFSTGTVYFQGPYILLFRTVYFTIYSNFT